MCELEQKIEELRIEIGKLREQLYWNRATMPYPIWQYVPHYPTYCPTVWCGTTTGATNE